MDFSPARSTDGACPRRRSRWGTSLALFLAVLAYPGASIEAQAVPPVETDVVREAPVIRKLELSGTVTSPHAAQISTSVEGLVSAVHFDNGAEVKRGDLLLELDPELEEAAHAQAQARALQAAAEVKDAERRLRIAESLAKRNYGPQNAVEAGQAEVEIDGATHDSFIAEQKRHAAMLARHRLPAPFDGVISKRMVEVGQWVEPGTAVFELVAMRDFRIDVPVPQDYYARLRDGAEVSVALDSLPGETVPAKIGALIPVSDPDTRTFTLRVLPQRDDIPIMPGMSARVMINLDTGKRDLVVSRDALIRYPDGRITVWVVTADGEAMSVTEKRIEIGLAFDGVVQVRSGLKDGDRVVVRGNEALREGQTVRLAS
ncbi:MAG TPA: efflux RND transporter periplasmic adaptor subunit [Methyloceanibacter sp.]|nr:efflux RND transporter periplasmic adaptor subunit [Methyloceanibacter sp.]